MEQISRKGKPKNLEEASAEELSEFLDSFDGILCDCDGVVIRVMTDPVPGTNKMYKLWRKLGKSVRFVTNNCTISLEKWHQKLNMLGFEVDLENLVNPLVAIIAHLKQINFNKKLFVIGFSGYKQELRDAGFTLTENLPDRIEESVPAFVQSLDDDEEVGAVICDWDMNSTYISLVKATTYLRRPEVLFLIGGTDDKLPIGKSTAPGPGYFQKIISNFTGRDPLVYGKPSVRLNDYIKRKYEIKDPQKILFVGDSLVQDMAFATKCGYKKLLVLSGITKLKDLENMKDEEVPDFYVENLGKLFEAIEKKLPHKL